MRLGCNGCDVTSGLPDDVTMRTVTLTMGHGQTSLPGYMVTSQIKITHLGYPTDVTMTTVILAVGYKCMAQAT